LFVIQVQEGADAGVWSKQHVESAGRDSSDDRRSPRCGETGRQAAHHYQVTCPLLLVDVLCLAVSTGK